MFDGIGYKIGMFVHAISTVLAGFVLAFLYQWKLTLVLISITPLLVVAGGILGKVTCCIILFKWPIRPETETTLIVAATYTNTLNQPSS